MIGENGMSCEQPSDEVEEKGRDGVEEEELAEKPKLSEGFYEIETIRRKRIRKGKAQYLIKWRGWPESANTWEPVENLMTCYDVIDAYEESLQSGKQRSTHKRKRKQGVTHTQIKRKQQQQHSPADGTYDVPALKVRRTEESVPSPLLDSLNVIDHVDSNGSDLNNIDVYKAANDNFLMLDSSEKEVEEQNKLGLKLNELNEVMATKETSVDRSGNGFTSEISTANGTESVQSARHIGAKRRKPAVVRRFRKETTSGVVNDPHDAIANAGPLVEFMQEGNYQALGCNNKCDDFKDDTYAITEIIKPMSYSASITSNDVQDVSVTFLVKRSDGLEVMVDNKFLKTNNPLLLINFYEKHLRYHPTE